jgi:tryptophan-rich sensory protein
VTRSAIGAAAICVVTAAAEGLFAGSGIRNRLASLRRPPFSPPFVVWVLIGLGYYVVAFTILYRLFRTGLPGAAHVVALWCVGLLLFVNALWNYFFFRKRDLRASLILNIPYGLIAIGLSAALIRVGDGIIWVFVPYLVYLVYGLYYGYATWRLNDGARAT